MERYKKIIDNRMKGAYADIDMDTKVIRINKARHKNKNILAREKPINRNPDGTEKIIDSMVHEELHAKHPKMLEKTVRKEAKKKVASMSRKQKQKIYNRYV